MKKGNWLITAILLAQASLLNAQTDLYNTGTLYVTGASDILYINGALTNTNTGALTNNGSLYVLQNLTNGQASMAIGTGTLYLSGTSAQVVGGTQPFRTFNLITNNAAGITLNANLSVSGAHTFTNGIIVTSSTPNYLVYEAGSSYSGAADSRHVNGWVKKIGTTAFDFPVGTGTYLRSAQINNLTASSEFNCRHYLITPNTLNVQFPIVSVDTYEYWDIPRVSGGNAQVRLNWDNSKVPFPPYALTDIRVVNYAAGLWTDRGGSATGNTTTTGVITSNVVSSFGLYTFGSQDFYVPLKFLHFTAQRKQNYSQLDWQTAKEINADHFDVERSEDGVTFRKIGAVTANNSLATNNYTYNDQLPLNGTAWYRIRSVDRNGAYNYSSIAVVSERRGGDGLYVINNPVYQYIHVSATGQYTGSYEYVLINAAGQLMQKGNVNANGGITTIPLTATVTPGVYVLDMKSTKHRLTQKIVVR
jgi:hypothetical protein